MESRGRHAGALADPLGGGLLLGTVGFVQLCWSNIPSPDLALLPVGFWLQDPLLPGSLLAWWSLGEASGEALLGHQCCWAGLCLQERFVVHVTDVLAVSMMLGITAQVKEAGIAWDKGEKKSKNPEWGCRVRDSGTQAQRQWALPQLQAVLQGPGRGQGRVDPQHNPQRLRELREAALSRVFVPLCDPQVV